MEEDKWEFDVPKFWDFTGTTSQKRPDESWFCEANISGPSFPTKKKRRPLRMFNTAEKAKQIKPLRQDSQPKQSVFDRLSKTTTISSSRKSAPLTQDPQHLQKQSHSQESLRSQKQSHLQERERRARQEESDIIEPPTQTVSQKIAQFEQIMVDKENVEEKTEERAVKSTTEQEDRQRSLFAELNAYHSRESIASFKEKMNVFDDDVQNEDDSLLSMENFQRAIAKERTPPVRTASKQQEDSSSSITSGDLEKTSAPSGTTQLPIKQHSFDKDTIETSPAQDSLRNMRTNSHLSNHTDLEDPFDSSPIVSNTKSPVASSNRILERKDSSRSSDSSLNKHQEADKKSRDTTSPTLDHSNSRFHTRIESYHNSGSSLSISSQAETKKNRVSTSEKSNDHTYAEHQVSLPRSFTDDDKDQSQTFNESLKSKHIPLSRHNTDAKPHTSPENILKPSATELKSPRTTKVLTSPSSPQYEPERDSLYSSRVAKDYLRANNESPPRLSSQNNLYNHNEKNTSLSSIVGTDHIASDIKGKKREDFPRKPLSTLSSNRPAAIPIDTSNNKGTKGEEYPRKSSNTSTLSMLAGLRAPVVVRHAHLTYSSQVESERRPLLTLQEIRQKFRDVRRQIRQVKVSTAQPPTAREKITVPETLFSSDDSLEKAREVLEASKERSRGLTFSREAHFGGQKRRVVDIETTVSNARKLLEESRKKKRKWDLLDL